MPLFGAKKTSRGPATSTVVRKSRNSVRTASNKSLPGSSPAGQKGISPLNSATGILSDSDSDDETVKHPEALPATDVTIYNEYHMGPAFGCKFPLSFIRFMIDRLISQKLRGGF